MIGWLIIRSRVIHPKWEATLHRPVDLTRTMGFDGSRSQHQWLNISNNYIIPRKNMGYIQNIYIYTGYKPRILFGMHI